MDIAKMTNMEFVLFCIAGFSTVVLLIQSLLMVVGMDFDADVMDMEGTDFEFEDQSGLRLFTIKGGVSFLSGFGWSGLSALEYGLSEWTTLWVALSGGVLLAFLYALTMMLLGMMHAPNIEDVRDAVGKSGTVYLTIPENGTGKITVQQNGRMSVLDARSKSGQINTGDIVQVVDLRDGVLYVQKVNN